MVPCRTSRRRATSTASRLPISKKSLGQRPSLATATNGRNDPEINGLRRLLAPAHVRNKKPFFLQNQASEGRRSWSARNSRNPLLQLHFPISTRKECPTEATRTQRQRNMNGEGGFEPPKGFDTLNGLANRRFRPLSHLSRKQYVATMVWRRHLSFKPYQTQAAGVNRKIEKEPATSGTRAEFDPSISASGEGGGREGLPTLDSGRWFWSTSSYHHWLGLWPRERQGVGEQSEKCNSCGFFEKSHNSNDVARNQKGRLRLGHAGRRLPRRVSEG